MTYKYKKGKKESKLALKLKELERKKEDILYLIDWMKFDNMIGIDEWGDAIINEEKTKLKEVESQIKEVKRRLGLK